MATYADRLISRARGPSPAAAPMLPQAPAAPALGHDPFEHAAIAEAPASPAIAPAPAPMLAPVERAPVEPAPIAAPIALEPRAPLEPARSVHPPDLARADEPAAGALAPSPERIERTERVTTIERELVREHVVVPLAPVEDPAAALTALRPPARPADAADDRWLAPAPLAPIAPPPARVEPPRAATPREIPRLAPPATPRARAESRALAPVVPVVEPPRPPPPSLSIGRVVVEVRRAPPARPAASAPVIVRVAAAAPSTTAGGFLHRGFGLGQG